MIYNGAVTVTLNKVVGMDNKTQMLQFAQKYRNGIYANGFLEILP
jgi:hypothetical protein